MTSKEGRLLRLDGPHSQAVVLDDDGRVAYAYLLENENVVGDVWLYNVVDSPESPEWPDPSNAPFLNPKDFCKTNEKLSRLDDESAVTCGWFEGGVDVSIEGRWVARLVRGAKPGWSLLAAKRGPLALPLEES